MKKLLSIIFVSVLLSGNAYAESSWFEITNDDDNTSYHFNLKKVEEISPNKNPRCSSAQLSNELFAPTQIQESL